MGLLDSNYNTDMFMNGMGLLTAKYADQADKYRERMYRAKKDQYARDRQAKLDARQAIADERSTKQWEQQQAAYAQKLEGQKKFQNLLGVPAINGHPGIDGQAATGYHADKDLTKLATGMMGTPGYESSGLGLLQEQIKAGLKDTSAFNGFKDKKAMLDAQSKVKNNFRTRTNQTAATMDMFQASTDMLNRVGGFDNMEGADDTLLMKSFAKHVLPKESVMGDDMRIIGSQQGMESWALSALVKLQNGGTLSTPERARIYQTMSGLNKSNFHVYTDEMGRAEWLRRMSGLPADSIYKQNFAVPYPVKQDDLRSLLDQPKEQIPTIEPVVNKKSADSFYNEVNQ